MAFLKESMQLGCVVHDSDPRKGFQREKVKLGPNHTV